VADDQSVPAAPVGTAGTPEEAEVQDVTAALQDKTAALPPEAPAVPTAELQARAVAGDPRAQNELASRLIAADPPNVEEAANWFREAAIQGVPGAQYNLGVLYERGLGVREDETRALLWYHSAAEQGHPLAQYNLGILYAAGRAVPLSYSEAAVWFERAAERGVPAAAYNLAVLLEGGLGRQRDMDQAMAYYERAKELGHRGAAQRLAGETPTSAGDGLLDLAETTSNSGTVGGREIAEIQQHLSDIGFYTGIVDGIAGPQTRSAISRYQASEELPVTGLPSSGLLRHLKGNT
jgi:TPR repeat protein